MTEESYRKSIYKSVETEVDEEEAEQSEQIFKLIQCEFPDISKKHESIGKLVKQAKIQV